MIADAERPIGIAGVMGGENTEVSDATTSVLLEAANFEPLTVLRSGERHHMRTESQTRWEKGVDSGARAGRGDATRRSCSSSSRAPAGPARPRCAAEPPEPPRDRAIAPRTPSAALGLEIAEAEQRERLGRLGFAVDGGLDGGHAVAGARATCAATSTSSRRSARFRLEDVPATLPVRQAMFGRLTHDQRLRRQVEDVLVGAGLYEAYTYSLQPERSRSERARAAGAAHARSSGCCARRSRSACSARRGTTSTWGTHDVALFEVAHVYLPVRAEVPDERWQLGGIAAGRLLPRQGGRRGDLRRAARRAALRARAACSPARPSARRCRAAGSRSTGRSSLDGEWSAFELDLEELFALVPERILYRDVITYPPLRPGSRVRRRRGACRPAS